MSDARDQQWGDFAARVAETLDRDLTDVTEDARIIEDLGADSLAVLEIVVAVADDYGVEDYYEDMVNQRWTGVTVGELFRQHKAKLARASQGS